MIVKGDGASKYCVGMCIFLFRNLKSRIKRDFLLRSSSGDQFNDCNIFVIRYTISVIPPPWFI